MNAKDLMNAIFAAEWRIKGVSEVHKSDPAERIIVDGSAPFERGPIHVEQQNDMITVLPKGWFNESYFTSSGWRCELFGANPTVVINPYKGQVPNAFWRWMQYLCFGNKWIKEEKK